MGKFKCKFRKIKGFIWFILIQLFGLQVRRFSGMELAEKWEHLSTYTLSYDRCIAESVNNPKLRDSRAVGKKFCAANSRGEGICMGDNGSPLVSRGTLIGIASSSSYCADGSPDVYTNVYAYSAWINAELSK